MLLHIQPFPLSVVLKDGGCLYVDAIPLVHSGILLVLVLNSNPNERMELHFVNARILQIGVSMAR